MKAVKQCSGKDHSNQTKLNATEFIVLFLRHPHHSAKTSALRMRHTPPFNDYDVQHSLTNKTNIPHFAPFPPPLPILLTSMLFCGDSQLNA